MNKTLYKRSKSGKIQQWTIEVESDKFRTKEGFVDGVITTNEWTICQGKSLGTKKETTPEQQALKEAEAKVKKQLDRGWTEDVNAVDEAVVKISPMLAKKYEDYKEYVASNRYIASQCKYDGIRCIATKDGLFTRNGKPIVAVPHIWEEVCSILDGLSDNVKLDGELYSHCLREDFNTIVSCVRKQTPTREDLEKSKQIQYHIYDIDIPNQVFASRYSALQQLLSDCKDLIVAPTVFLTLESEEDFEKLNSIYQEYLEEGYEGQMIRISNSNYENSRSKNLLKRKEFQDEEFTIIDIEEGVGNRSGMMGRIKFDGFDANARGTHEYFRELLVNKEQYIGKKATVRFQNWTVDRVPRFPVVIAIRDYE